MKKTMIPTDLVKKALELCYRVESLPASEEQTEMSIMASDIHTALKKYSHVISQILDERNSQDVKWGEQNHHPMKWNVILGEEFGEASKAILEKDPVNYREELIQVAAVAIAAVESFDRNPSF